MTRSRFVLVSASVLFACSESARGEPHLAMWAGLSCSACHANRTGGGGRTAYGAGYGSQQLPWRKTYGAAAPLDGAIHARVRLGGDLRGAYLGRLRKDAPYVGEYRLSEANVYLTADITFYVDERLAPGAATAQELFALIKPGPRGVYVRPEGSFCLSGGASSTTMPPRGGP